MLSVLLPIVFNKLTKHIEITTRWLNLVSPRHLCVYLAMEQKRACSFWLSPYYINWCEWASESWKTHGSHAVFNDTRITCFVLLVISEEPAADRTAVLMKIFFFGDQIHLKVIPNLIKHELDIVCRRDLMGPLATELHF